MNTKLILTVLTLSATFGLADRATFDKTKTQIAMPLAPAPVIDGVINSDEWKYAGGYPGNFWVIAPNANLTNGDPIQGGKLANTTDTVPSSAADLSFYIYAGFDTNNLYVAVHVVDDVISTDNVSAGSVNGKTSMDDSVEIYIDGDNSNFATVDSTGTNPAVVATGGQFSITANNAYREVEAGNPGYGPDKAWYALTSPRADGTGYDAEFRISLQKLGNPKPGDIIGFTVAVNDNDGSGTVRKMMWVGTPNLEASYGNLLLGGRTYSAPKVTKAPTIDGTIDPAEYAGAQEIKINVYNGVYDLTSGDDTWPLGDHGFSAWVVHDTNAIYVAIDATDDKIFTDTAAPGSDNGNTWLDDSVEIFFDADLDRNVGGPTLGFEGQYVLTANGARRENEAGNPAFGPTADWYGAVSTNSHGFQAEFKVTKSALSNPADGATLGFHITQNDDDQGGGIRKAQIGWSGRAHTESSYGTLTLVGVGSGSPTLSIARSGKDLLITFTGSLQSASAVNAPFSDVANATSPFKVTPSGTATFYRAKN